MPNGLRSVVSTAMFLAAVWSSSTPTVAAFSFQPSVAQRSVLPHQQRSSISVVHAVPNSKFSFDGAALKGFIRGQKCLFNDEEIRYGSIIYLLRGADSSQRYVFPLELETNKNLLPGQIAAQVFFDEYENALSEVLPVVAKKHQLDLKDAYIGQMLADDLGSFLRVMQYGVAAGVTTCMREEVLKHMAELYDETNFPYPALIEGVELLQSFFQKKVDDQDYNTFVAPVFANFLDILQEMKKYEAPSPVDVAGKNLVPNIWESPAEKRTVPTPYYDIATIDLNSVPEAQRASVKEVQDAYRK